MFKNDYCTIACKEVMDALTRYVDVKQAGYGTDKHCENASKLILNRFGLTKRNANVYFLVGGTQTNMSVISYLLRPYEAVIACDTGHINVHETGAVEGSGHKVVTANNNDGKLLATDIEQICNQHIDEHKVKLRMVYISDSTESGTIYTKKELSSIRKVCDAHNLLLFVDGARLGAALTCQENDVEAKYLAKIADVFYIGGTKNGALFGEAVVIKKAIDNGDFKYHVKNKGALLAKGFILGIQFETLFKDDLFFKLAQRSNFFATKIKEELTDLNIEFVGTSPTNQLFIKTDDKTADKLIEKFGLELWENLGSYKIVRIVTSFATTEEEIEELVDFIKNIH